MMRMIKRFLAWTIAPLATAILLFVTMTAWPAPLFAYAVGSGKIVVVSDRPIPPAGAERFLQDCERLLERSPLKAESRQYRVYVTNENWRHRLFFLLNPAAGGSAYYYGFAANAFLSGANFETGRLVKWDYVATPPRTLTYFCAHELTHLVEGEHFGVHARLYVPTWVWEGFADYVGIENRQSFEELRDALGDRPFDLPMMQAYGTYAKYRLLVTYFLEKKGWSVEQLFATKLSTDDALGLMRANE